MYENAAYHRLVACGVRPSMQRLAIMNYLLDNATHPTVEEVHRHLVQKIPSLSRTTLYNTLRLFSEHGAAQMLTIDDHRVCYDGDIRPHVHFFCKKCGRVIDLFDVPAPSAVEVSDIDGNRMDEVQLYYRGVCVKCLEQE